MSDKSKYCCFVCPKGDFSEKSLDDPCPICGLPYGFPLTQAPLEIAGFKVVEALGRGFYGATYVSERVTGIKRRRVLKVTPQSMYTTFGKAGFDVECQEHADLADNADYIVGIDDMFDADVDFDGTVIPCHVAVLEHLDGRLLADYVTGKVELTAAAAAQIACDLVRMHGEISRGQRNHNDLHASNIVVEKLSSQKLRQGAIEPSLRAVAIDLGSASGDRRSGGSYAGDLHWIARHIDRMVERLLAPGDDCPDLDARVALALKTIAQDIAPGVEKQRTPRAEDLIARIEQEFFRTAEPWRPWREPLLLRSFNASYNAKTLDAWHVPQLLVDPDGRWQGRMTAPGPLVITGMRGCGKTLLLRALQFHARAARHPKDKTDTKVLTRIRKDNYVGLFVSAQRLLDVDPGDSVVVQRLFARLYVAYALEASRALAHLADLNGDLVREEACEEIAELIRGALQPTVQLPVPTSIEQLERVLVTLLAKVSRIDSQHVLAAHPSNAFPDLAATIRKASSTWTTAQVLFLLDDVSTRYMSSERVEELCSALIFQNSICAFKLTSETQAIFLSLKSPGQVHPAAHWRDFATFDLGAEVQARLNEKHGRKFVEDILRQRAAFHPSHPSAAPSAILGDASLQEIAERIVNSSPDSRERKNAYHGITVMANVCVGDIGSIITLYENILARSEGRVPVPDHVQNEVYQDFCSRHLYLLDRRGSDDKNVASSFAEAAYELMMQSAWSGKDGRLRQYAAIYVRMTAGDLEEQRSRLRELVDAGIFVFTSGAPRTKTRDTNPVHQFKLVFRKIYGLANYIGLSDRDRFELSGAVLEEWLRNPKNGKEILTRNLRAEFTKGSSQSGRGGVKVRPTKHIAEVSKGLFDLDVAVQLPIPATLPAARLSMPQVAASHLLSETVPFDAHVLGLGFEERAEISARRLIGASLPKRLVAVRYDEEGRSKAILDFYASSSVAVEEVSYPEVAAGRVPDLRGRVLVDVTGLAKPAIFMVLRMALAQADSVCVAYTGAQNYYPLAADLEPVLSATANSNHHQLLLALKNVLTGEQGPYSLMPLLSSDSDGTRMRALYAFASAKHERLIQLVEERDYDLIRVMVGSNEGARSQVARIAAEVAVRGVADGSIERSGADDINSVVASIGNAYERWYVCGGLNFEMGLTGNKLQTVAAAIASSTLHINQVWYVRPRSFDPQRFTSGTANTQIYKVDWRPHTTWR